MQINRLYKEGHLPSWYPCNFLLHLPTGPSQGIDYQGVRGFRENYSALIQCYIPQEHYENDRGPARYSQLYLP